MQEKSRHILKLRHDVEKRVQHIHEIERGGKNVALLITNTPTT
jgi:hypothetical protein